MIKEKFVSFQVFIVCVVKIMVFWSLHFVRW